jgi:hypothetical protein
MPRQSESGKWKMRNLFFDMKIVFQKHSSCDGGVKTTEGDFESPKADFWKFDVTKIAVKKTSNGGGRWGSVSGNDLIGRRKIGTGDLVFVGKNRFGGGRSDYDGMGTFGRHIGNRGKRTT